MTKKLNSLIFWIIIFVSPVFSQMSSIEIKVEDTLIIVPDNYFYAVMIAPNTEDDIVNTIEGSRLNIISLETVKKYAEEANGQLMNYEQEFTVNNAVKDPYELQYIKMNRLKDIDDFTNKISKFDNIIGFLVTTSVDELDKYENELNKKLLEKAYNKGGSLANLIDKEIEDILSIEEVINSELGLNPDLNAEISWTAYPGLNQMPFLTTNNTGNSKYIYTKSIKIKFLLKNK